MPLAALLSAGAPAADAEAAPLRGTLHFAGQTLLEFQARQAAAAGVDLVVIMVGTVVPAISQAVDRLTGDGIAVLLVRDILSLARQVPRDHDILLIADGAVIDQGLLRQVTDTPHPALLVVPDSGPAGAMERIDAQYRWAGAARMNAAQLFDTLDMLGDWDLQSTLLRRVVQAGGERIPAPDNALLDGQVAIVDSQRAADVLADATLAVRMGDMMEAGPIERLLLGPVAALITPVLMRQQVQSTQMDIGAAVVAAIGLIAAQLDWKGIALPLLLVAALMTTIGARLRRASLRAYQGGWLPWAAPALVLVGVALIGTKIVRLDVNGWMGGISLALLLGLLGWLAEAGKLGAARSWPLCMPATALTILTLTQLVGLIHIGLAVSMLYAIVSLGFVLLERPAAASPGG